MSQHHLKPMVLQALVRVGQQRDFRAGQQITTKGAFSRTMFFVLTGNVEIRLNGVGEAQTILTVGKNSPLGEIGFLTGSAANASAIALDDVCALELGHEHLVALELKYPEAAIEFSRYLALSVDLRLQQNREVLGDQWQEIAEGVEVTRCVDDACLLACQKLRYLVYCEELQRTSPYADEENHTLCDPLDEFGASFLGTVDGVPAGTARVNLARDGDLGILTGLYFMDASDHHPQSTAVITKFAVSKNHRSGGVYAGLLNAVITYLDDWSISQIYMDGIPEIVRFYKKFGFKKCADAFIHYENGLSIPMVLEADFFRSESARENRKRMFKKLGLSL